MPRIDVPQHCVSLDTIPQGQRQLYGDKATRLAQMKALEFPVPPAVCLTSELIKRIIADPTARQDVGNYLPTLIGQLEKETGLKFGDRKSPLVVSVRSGGQKVMEGLLPTLQFVGLNSRTVKGLGRQFGDQIGAYRLYVSYIIAFGVTVRGVPKELFAGLTTVPSDKTRKKDIIQTYRRNAAIARQIISHHKGGAFPEDPYEQLQATIVRIAESWNDPSAKFYRERYRIPEDPPAALLIQKQVFGNLGSESAAVCAYSRHPKWGVTRTREQGVIGIAKLHASGDELMTGSDEAPQRLSDLTFRMREIATPLQDSLRAAERFFKMPVKFEVIVENGKMWILQVSPYPMWPIAVVRSAVDMKDEGILTWRGGWGRLDHNIWRPLGPHRFWQPNRADFLLTGRTEIAGTAKGRLINDYESIIHEKAPKEKEDKKYILITDGIDQPKWEKVFERVAGIIVLGDPGAHFFHRASQAGVPVMSRVKELGKSNFPIHKLDSLARRSARVWLDATGMEAYLTDRPLVETYGTVARYVKGEIGFDAVKDKDRSREQIEHIIRYRKLIDEKRRLDEARVAAEIGVVVDGFIGKGVWGVEELKGAILENHWGTEQKPPAELFMRHDGSTDPAIADFKYEFDEGKVAEFAKRLLAVDVESPKRFVRAFVEADELEHAFMTYLFRLIPEGQKGAFLNDFVREARAMEREPGRGSGIYMMSRMLSILSENADGARVVALLDHDTVRFIAGELQRFFEVGLSVKDLNWASRFDRREVEGIAIRYPLLMDEGKTGQFLADHLAPGAAERIYHDETIDPKRRLWFGFVLGQEASVRDILRTEEELSRPPVFDKDAYVQNLPRTGPEDVARYITSLQVPIPDLERGLHPLLETLGWGTYDYNVDEQQFRYQLSSEVAFLFNHLNELSPDLVADLMLETPQGTHALSVTFFKTLARDQQIQMMEGMVRLSRSKGYLPGIQPGLYLLSRFLSVLALDTQDPQGARRVIEGLSDETFLFVLEDFFVFHGIRTGEFGYVLGSERSVYIDAFRKNIGDRYQDDASHRSRYGDRDYAVETYQRYPGLDPRHWIPFIQSMEGDRLEKLLASPSVPEGIRLWYANLFKKVSFV